MILDLTELQKLSGYERPGDVKKWLRKNGVAFMVQSSGHPVSTLDAVNVALQSIQKKRSEPDFTPPPPAKPGRYRPGTGPKYMTLTAWAANQWGDTAPSLATLRRWNKQAKIIPAPQKRGRQLYVEADAQYVDWSGY